MPLLRVPAVGGSSQPVGALETHAGGFVTLRVPVIEFEGIAVDQIPLTDRTRAIEDGLNRAHVSHGIPIAPVDTIVLMKLIAGRTQDLADIEAMIESGADRERLKSAVQAALPNRLETLGRLFENVDRAAEAYCDEALSCMLCPGGGPFVTAPTGP